MRSICQSDTGHSSGIDCHERQERQAESADCSSEWEVLKALLCGRFPGTVTDGNGPLMETTECADSLPGIAADYQSWRNPERRSPHHRETDCQSRFGTGSRTGLEKCAMTHFSTCHGGVLINSPRNAIPRLTLRCVSAGRVSAVVICRLGSKQSESVAAPLVIWTCRATCGFEAIISCEKRRPVSKLAEPSGGQLLSGLGFREQAIRCTKLSGDSELTGNSGRCGSPAFNCPSGKRC